MNFEGINPASISLTASGTPVYTAILAQQLANYAAANSNPKGGANDACQNQGGCTGMNFGCSNTGNCDLTTNKNSCTGPTRPENITS